MGRNGIVTKHVGSTSVPGLCAKPVIDILLIVRDSSDEDAYVPQLERVGYTMRIREPEWFRHRMLKKHNPEVNLHVFSYGCSEAKRMLDFRDWLRTDEGDRMLYGNTKKALVQREWHYLQDYADAKSDVVREIFSHMECRTPQEKDACEIMPCVIRPWRTEDALEYMSFLAKSGQGQIYSNAASCRILENCGFSLEGILRCNAVKNGTVRDMRMYAALSSV